MSSLEAYDRNKNFDIGLDIQEDHTYICPPSDTFIDINADSPLPSVNKHEIHEYFERFNTRPKGQLLYESRHLVTARYSSDGTYTYLRGQCKASMKKVVYVIEIKLSQEDAIEECHCEYAAGSGTSASCKHVAVLLLGVHDMVYNKSIKLHQACTQQLMTFKKPKKVFYNSPIVAHKLPNKRLQSCNYDPLKESDIMDGYEDYVRNLAIGYGNTSMPLLQTYEPANPYGVEWDHCYTNNNPQETLLEDLLLKNVSRSTIETVEQNTRGHYLSPEWHERRLCRITASKFYAVSRYTSVGTNTLLQKILNPKSVHSRAVTHGIIHEPIAIKKYEIEYGLHVQKCGLFISKECTFLAASPDGLLGDATVKSSVHTPQGTV